jgi:uncharacterized phage-associated protein
VLPQAPNTDGIPFAWECRGPSIELTFRPLLYQKHRGQFSVKTWPNGDWKKITGEAKMTIDSVLKFYGDKTGHWLSELTHKERPWRDARVGLSDDDRCNRAITLAAMAEYYGGL